MLTTSDSLEFQSHAGSIEASIPGAGLRHSGFQGFNPTLVRLRHSPGISQDPSQSCVSIPRWFD